MVAVTVMFRDVCSEFDAPEISPVLAFKVKPVGKVPLVTANVAALPEFAIVNDMG